MTTIGSPSASMAARASKSTDRSPVDDAALSAAWSETAPPPREPSRPVSWACPPSAGPGRPDIHTNYAGDVQVHRVIPKSPVTGFAMDRYVNDNVTLGTGFGF